MMGGDVVVAPRAGPELFDRDMEAKEADNGSDGPGGGFCAYD